VAPWIMPKREPLTEWVSQLGAMISSRIFLANTEIVVQQRDDHRDEGVDHEIRDAVTSDVSELPSAIVSEEGYTDTNDQLDDDDNDQ